jgi:hypothetical protein
VLSEGLRSFCDPEHFRVDQDEFNDRHEMLVTSFEHAKISLGEYLDRTFYRERPFTRDAFPRFYLLAA